MRDSPLGGEGGGRVRSERDEQVAASAQAMQEARDEQEASTGAGAEADAWDDIDRQKKAPKGDKPVIVPLVRVTNGIVQNVIMKILRTAKLLQNKKEFLLLY